MVLTEPMLHLRLRDAVILNSILAEVLWWIVSTSECMRLSSHQLTAPRLSRQKMSGWQMDRLPREKPFHQ